MSLLIYLWLQVAICLFQVATHALVLRHLEYPRREVIVRARDWCTVITAAGLGLWAGLLLWGGTP